MTARAHAIIACDFLVVETVLLKRLHVLVFIEHATRRLHLAGVTARPTAAWAVQQARNLAMDLDDRLGTMRFKSEGLRIITTLPRTPWMNATCERVIGTLRREMLDRTLILSDRHLDLALREYVTHYDGHRPHQSRQQRAGGADRVPDGGQRGTRVEQRAQQHVARETRNRVEPADHWLTVRARAMRCAAIAAPNPESMFTTVTPAAQEACMASSAVIPSKLVP